jgi:hypothetical protein
VDDEERIDLAEQNVVGLDEVTGPYPFGVVLHEGRPALAAVASAASAAHVLLDRALAGKGVATYRPLERADARTRRTSPGSLSPLRVRIEQVPWARTRSRNPNNLMLVLYHASWR